MCAPWFFDGKVLHSLAGMDVMVNTVEETGIPVVALPTGVTHVLGAWSTNGDVVFPMYAGTKEACQVAFTVFFRYINDDSVGAKKIINHEEFADQTHTLLAAFSQP